MAIRTELLDYTHGDATLEGFLAWDDALAGPSCAHGRRPGVAIVPDFMGVGPEAQRRATMLAELGYVAFAIDLHGKGKRPKSSDEARLLAGQLRADRPALRARAGAGLARLRADPRVDGTRLVAIGYCIGGMTALEMARGGEDLRAAVSFHGSLDTPVPVTAIQPRILVLHGADDPGVTQEHVANFIAEMRAAKADWQLVQYGGVVHSFTDPHANVPGRLQYDARADRHSWRELVQLLAEVFSEDGAQA